MAGKPRVPEDIMYQLLREEKVMEFNLKRTQGVACDLRSVDLRGNDLRALNVDGLDLTDAYLRGADLRGLDFRNTKLEGVSLKDAKISGCYFPKELRMEEILASVTHGIRMRYT